MAKREIIWSLHALKNLDDLHNYLIQFSVQGAENVLNEILESTKRLIKDPEFGRPEPIFKESGFPHRYLRQRHFKIIYHIDKGRIYIDRIFSMYQHPSRLKKGK